MIGKLPCPSLLLLRLIWTFSLRNVKMLCWVIFRSGCEWKIVLKGPKGQIYAFAKPYCRKICLWNCEICRQCWNDCKYKFWVFFFNFNLLGNGEIEHLTLTDLIEKKALFSHVIQTSLNGIWLSEQERSAVGLLLLTEFLLTTFASVIFRLYNFKVWRHLKEHSNTRK